MNANTELEMVIEAYVLAREQGDEAALARLTTAYPAHEHALTAYALLDAAVPTAPAAGDLAAAAPLLTAALKARALAAALAPIEAVEAIPGILVRARQVGLDGRALARAVDLPRDVVLQLDRGLIAATSVPRALVARLAESLRSSVEAVSACLAGGTAPQVAAFHYAPDTPRAGTPITFAEAMAGSGLATDEQRAWWVESAREEGLA